MDTVRMSELANSSYLYGANAVFIEELYSKYSEDPSSVSEEWARYFASLGDSGGDVRLAVTQRRPGANGMVAHRNVALQALPQQVSSAAISDAVAVAGLISAYRALGHLHVNLDPLGLQKSEYCKELDYKSYGFTEADLDREVYACGLPSIGKYAKLSEIIKFLSSKYCSRMGVEYMHLSTQEEKAWMQQKIEGANLAASVLSPEERRKALFDLLEAEVFEHYLHTKFPGAKRFSVEGGEAAIAAVEFAIRNSVESGVREVVLGMAHRGRLNVLTKVMGKPYHAMLSEFKGELAFPAEMNIPGDVKYHLGTSTDIEVNGVAVHMSLVPNPSHLEVVNSVVLGKVRAKQDQRGDVDRKEVLALLIHGDAAFAGQGSVAESLYLSQLSGYHIGGALHIIINNQIGFTTNPSDARSTKYCSDVAKAIEAPVFHVNGDDLEGVILATKLASEYRTKFKKDVVIDITCYRKYGHNEGDEPSFTQPLMYDVVRKHEVPHAIYSRQLISENIISENEYTKHKADFILFLESEYVKSQTYHPTMADWLQGSWGGLKQADVNRTQEKTGVDAALLAKFGQVLCTVPKGFNIHPKIAKQLEIKKKMFEDGNGIDWATGEALAFASLLNEGFGIRMSGQDVKRGTFSHRHAVLFDQDNESQYIPLNNLNPNQKKFLEIHNSNLSEFAVMGFEYGYSFTDPRTLTIWEGQFGDFANGAQVIIDQYLVSGELKWLRMSGLVLLLPHGYEGQGPEHSSARLERFLQLAAQDNIQVVNCSTPASYYHVLRRQLQRNFRKPLIVMSPKSLLRHKLAVSSISEMGDGTRFLPVIDEVRKITDPSKVRKVVICSGKIYYDLYEKREELKADDIALVRMEEYYPFPSSALGEVLKKYNSAKVFWCQEEHENMGAYYFVEPRIEKVLKEIQHICKRAEYIGRPCSASPAVGYLKLHQMEQKKLLEEVFNC